MSSWHQHRWFQQATTDPRSDAVFVVGLLVLEVLLSFGIIQKVAYTEIDWQAYMEQTETFHNGERDYYQIKGGTGPLVYPAGFLYLFDILRLVTNHGSDIAMAQYIFLGFYMLTQGAVLYIYSQQTRLLRRTTMKQSNSTMIVWSWRLAMTVLCLSKRVHSIYLLRLFNDGPTMLLCYVSIALFVKQYWNAGCLVFSWAVSIKMNVLLFAPGLLLLLLQISDGSLYTVLRRLVLFCALPQAVLGAPFLTSHPVAYLRKAFELDREFFYQWTVNWKVRTIIYNICCIVYYCTAMHAHIISSSSLLLSRLYCITVVVPT